MDQFGHHWGDSGIHFAIILGEEAGLRMGARENFAGCCSPDRYHREFKSDLDNDEEFRDNHDSDFTGEDSGFKPAKVVTGQVQPMTEFLDCSDGVVKVEYEWSINPSGAPCTIPRGAARWSTYKHGRSAF